VFNRNVLDDIVGTYTREDIMIAIQAAMQMAKKFEEDFAILSDLSVVRLVDNDEPPLEIVRYRGF